MDAFSRIPRDEKFTAIPGHEGHILRNMTLSSACSFFSRALMSAGLALSIASCGGGGAAENGTTTSSDTQATAQAEPKAGVAAFAPEVTVASWTNCATESGTCTFSGTR